MTVTLLSVITLTGRVAAEIINGIYEGLGVAACAYAVVRLGGAAARYLHVRHDAAWAAAYFPHPVRDVLATTLRTNQGTVGSVACRACHGYAWMIAENTPDGPVTTTGHAWSRTGVDRRVNRTSAARALMSRDGDPLLPEHISEPPGE